MTVEEYFEELKDRILAKLAEDPYYNKKVICLIHNPDYYNKLFGWDKPVDDYVGEYKSYSTEQFKFYWSDHINSNMDYPLIVVQGVDTELKCEYYPYTIDTHNSSKEKRAEYRALHKKAGCNLAGGCVLNKYGTSPMDCKKCPYVTGEKKLNLEDENIKQLIQSRKSKDGCWLF